MNKDYSSIYKEYLKKCHSPLDNTKVYFPRNWSKIYYNTPKILLNHEVNIEDRSLNLSTLLKLSYGQTHLDVVNRKMEDKHFIQKFRRAIPSGGGVYPNELYVWMKDDPQGGIYHYNPIGHELSLIKKSIFQSEIKEIINQKDSISDYSLVFFITNIFDKNTYKYKNLSYRIQCLDTGVVLQRFNEMLKHFNFKVNIVLNFLDKRAEELIDISKNEGLLGVLTVQSGAKKINFPNTQLTNNDVVQKNIGCIISDNLEYSKSDALDFIERLHYKSNVNKTMLQNKSGEELPMRTGQNNKLLDMCIEDIIDYIDKRQTNFHYFKGTKISKKQLLLILSSVSHTEIYSQDALPVSLYLYLNQIEDIENGFYRYELADHKLCYINNEDIPSKIRENIIQPDLDLNKVNITAFIVGDHYKAYCLTGNRGYRILNISTGLILEKLLSNATINGLGTYPFLAYDVNLMKDTLNLQNDEFPLIIAFIGVKDQIPKLTFKMY